MQAKKEKEEKRERTRKERQKEKEKKTSKTKEGQKQRSAPETKASSVIPPPFPVLERNQICAGEIHRSRGA